MLLYDDEPDEVINFFVYCTNLIQTDPTILTPTFQIVNVYGNGSNEERILKKTFKNALTNVKKFCLIIKLKIFFLEYLAFISWYSQ